MKRVIFYLSILDLVKDYKRTDLVQTKKYIKMNRSNYINRFLNSLGWDVSSDQPDPAPTTVTNSRMWDLWMDAEIKIDRGDNNPDNGNTNVWR